MRDYDIKPNLQKILNKLSKKDKVAYEAVLNKIQEIINSEDVEHYKNLKYDMKNLKEVHIAKSFVLVFNYDKTNNSISFLDYDHHDKIFFRK
ncbi:MAG TPA: addiction module toxin RelE [Candidatus Nanoarchaeia archaeon]|nr:addiction module toxin RelE [Candidatus Nanoarchaeia archaeon]